MKLRVRNFDSNKDAAKLVEMHAENCDFPALDLSDPLYFVLKVVEDADENIVAFGVMRLTSETILIMDHHKPKVLRARAIKKLIEPMTRAAKEQCIDETHIFTDNSSLARVLMKSFDLIRCKDRALYLQF